MGKLLKGNSGASILLTVVKLFTTVSGILSTMIMSHALSLELYGTYSQTALIVTTATNISALGLVDAVNYFYNRSTDVREQKKYTDTVLGFQCIMGVIAACLILLLANGLTAYFNNPLLRSFFWLISFRPLFANLNVSLQYLQVSIGKAKSVALRNAGFATLRLVVFAITSYLLQDIRLILITFLAFEIFITVFFGVSFIKEKFALNPLSVDWKKTGEIMGYSIPMGIYVLTNSLSRDIDKMLIGGWCNTDQYAIYANCATLLPFDIVSASFLAVLIPILTRYFGNKDYKSGRLLFRNYLKVGYYTSFTFTVACIILSREMVIFLYGEKYLSGRLIFVLYIIVDMVKFANMSIVLSACGRTKTLMVCSVGSLGANALLNIIFYRAFGFYGPAIATVVVTVMLTTILAQMSAKALHTTIIEVIDWKDILQFIIELVLIAMLCVFLKSLFVKYNFGTILTLFLTAVVFMTISFGINIKKLLGIMKAINGLE